MRADLDCGSMQILLINPQQDRFTMRSESGRFQCQGHAGPAAPLVPILGSFLAPGPKSRTA